MRAVVLVTAGYGYWLLPSSGTGLPGWLAPALVGLGTGGRCFGGDDAPAPRSRRSGGGAAAAGVVIAGHAAGSVGGIGVRGGEQPGAVRHAVPAGGRDRLHPVLLRRAVKPLSTLPKIEAVRNGAPDLMATQTSVLAAPLIFATGQEVLPIGGYTGTIPEPTVANLRSMVAAGTFHLVLVAAHSRDPRILWIARHCQRVPTPPNPGSDVGPLDTFYCVPRP